MKILFIAGSTHSGTTLLNRVLGAHSRMHNVGGIKNLPAAIAGQKKCSCQAGNLLECPFWNSVEKNVYNNTGKHLSDLQVNSDNMTAFAADNTMLLEAIEEIAGCDIIVDSSRSASRLRKLMRMPGLEIYPVHIFKYPPAQAASWKKKKMPVSKWLPRYWDSNLPSLIAMKKIPRSVWVSYEKFCADPEHDLRRILEPTGLEYEASMLTNWGKTETHILGGNRMQKSKSSEIRLDQSWQGRLSPWENRLMSWSSIVLWKRLNKRS